MEFGLGMQDCDKCIELAPDFIKGHLRKAALLKIEKPAVSYVNFYIYFLFIRFIVQVLGDPKNINKQSFRFTCAL